MKNTRTKPEKQKRWVDYLRPMLISCGVGIAVTAVMLFLFALLLSVRDLPHGAIEPMATVAMILGAMTAGFTCSRLCKEKGLLLGMLCGLILFGVLTLGGMTVSDDGLGVAAWLRLAILTLSGGIGGVFGVNLRLKRK